VAAPLVGNRYPTYYFRHGFSVTNPSSTASLTLRYLRDDGCLIYLNGVEIVRSNMPGGSIGYNTLATSAIGGADETSWHQTAVNPALLQAGTNVIAVELHQSAINSSDISFDLELISTTPQAPTPAVTLLSPADKGLSNTAAVTFTTSANDVSGLLSATLHLSSDLRSSTFSGPQQIQDTQLSADQPSTSVFQRSPRDALAPKRASIVAIHLPSGHTQHADPSQPFRRVW